MKTFKTNYLKQVYIKVLLASSSNWIVIMVKNDFRIPEKPTFDRCIQNVYIRYMYLNVLLLAGFMSRIQNFLNGPWFCHSNSSFFGSWIHTLFFIPDLLAIFFHMSIILEYCVSPITAICYKTCCTCAFVFC